MAQILIITGAAIFGILGAFHLAFTFFTNKFDAFDPLVTEAMKSTSPILTKETTVWRAWIGFNASHSFGAMLFAAIYMPLATFHFELLQASVWFSMLPVLVSVAYLVLAKIYWFKVPFFGILISTLCFITSASLINF